MLEGLRHGPRPVGEIAQQLPVSRPAVSQHLRVLKEADLVIDEQIGTRRIYRVNPKGLEELRAYLDAFWDEALVQFAAVAESSDEGRKRWQRGGRKR